MRVSLRWLADYVDLVLSPEELAQRLTMSGTEVVSIERVGAGWDKVYVGRVTRRAPHPNADRLQLVTVDYGDGREITVVTGAFNIEVGDKVPLALVGARLIDAYSAEPRMATLKPTKIRGIVSEGMVVSARELGLGEDHTGIYILDPGAPVGAPLAEVLGDTILELEVTPNRPDLLCMLGVAREVAALTGQTVRVPEPKYPEQGMEAEALVTIEIEDPDLCPRYSAVVITGVQIGPSPEWMQRRLVAAGMRPINNVVDVTNYVMLEWDQPLHAFDFDKIRGQHIIVRRARPGEAMTTLDGVHREFTDETLLIADEVGPVAVAGVMGGLQTEVTDSTTTVLLESANFNPVSIRKTARRLRLPSEASRRFEKGLPQEQTVPAARRAAQLMHELAGGTVAPGVADSYPIKQEERTIVVAASEVERLLGVRYGMQPMVDVLQGLGFGVKSDDDVMTVRVPFQRLDVALPADVVEEVARIIGYDSIPTTLLSGEIPEPLTNKELQIEELVRWTLVGAGFSEVITYSLTSRSRMDRLLAGGPSPDAILDALGENAEGASTLAGEVTERIMPLNIRPLAVFNPLSADAAVLRTTALASALETLASNLRQFDRDVNLFEIGRIYLPRDGDLPEERRVLTMVMGAYHSGRQWGAREENDFFDIKGVTEVLLDRLGVRRFEFIPIVHPTFHPGRAAAVVLGSDGASRPGTVVGAVGEVNDRVLASFGIGQPAYLAGFDLGRLIEAADLHRLYQPLPRFPAVLQDIAVVVDEAIPAAQVSAIICDAGGKLVRKVELFDLYRGAPLPPGKKSLAFHITYQAPDRTLTDREVAVVHERIQKALRQQLGATFRA